MNKLIVILAAAMMLSGCASPGNTWKAFIGTSTQEIEETRADAMVKVFDYNYKTCYAKTEALLKKMPFVSIYAKTDSMIAVNYINPDTTPVGLFFKAIDATHTQIEISSPSTPAKEWIAKNVFSEKVIEQEKAKMKF